jgi:predicted transport protein
MSEIRLFRFDGNAVDQLKAEAVALEKSLQSLIEKHLELLLGVRFLATEFGTGRNHGGRIDTLGIDENGCPVIIEYKRHGDHSVINQGLYYLDWLMDHRGDFKVLVQEVLGAVVAGGIDWASPRLLCIANEFKKFDSYAIKQIDRNIELIEYARFGPDMLMLNPVARGEAKKAASTSSSTPGKASNPTVAAVLEGMGPQLADVWSALQAFLLDLGDVDEVTVKETKLYMAFRRLKNFACVRPTKVHLIVWTKVDPDTVELESGFTRDVRTIGHYGTGDLEILISDLADLNKAKHLLLTAFEDN